MDRRYLTCRDASEISREPQDVTIKSKNLSVGCFTQPGGVLRDSIQYRLNIGRRAGNDAQDLTRGRLLLQRLLKFLEQPDVLDGDHCLVGEGFEKSYLLI